MTYGKTAKMQAVEERHGTLEDILPDLVTNQGLSLTAAEIGVSKATLGYWLLKLGITVRRVALNPGDQLEVKRVRGGEVTEAMLDVLRPRVAINCPWCGRQSLDAFQTGAFGSTGMRQFVVGFHLHLGGGLQINDGVIPCFAKCEKCDHFVKASASIGLGVLSGIEVEEVSERERPE